MIILGVETSCDETSAAVVADGGKLLSNVVSSQIELHKPYGGVVPEIASRNHLQLIDAVIEDALQRASVRLDQIDGIAATCGPGLASSLLIGLTTAKGLAYALGVPFIGINHLEAHLFSPFLGDGAQKQRGPFVALIVSGGHTILTFVRDVDNYEVLGQTIDDAAGEAFDKVAKLLGLGYPGGPEIDRLASTGNPAAVDFPRSMLDDPSFNFSFSGLKTAALYHVRGVPASRRGDSPRRTKFASASAAHALGHLDTHALADLCASFQEAIVDVLVGKTLRAAREKKVKLIAVSGGVACNTRLREKLSAACSAEYIQLLVADPHYCTDNAAMIGALALLKLQRGHRSDLTLDVDPNLTLGAGAH